MNPPLLSDNFQNESGAAAGIERTSETWEDLKRVSYRMVDRSNPLAHFGSYLRYRSTSNIASNKKSFLFGRIDYEPARKGASSRVATLNRRDAAMAAI